MTSSCHPWSAPSWVVTSAGGGERVSVRVNAQMGPGGRVQIGPGKVASDRGVIGGGSGGGLRAEYRRLGYCGDDGACPVGVSSGVRSGDVRELSLV